MTPLIWVLQAAFTIFFGILVCLGGFRIIYYIGDKLEARSNARYDEMMRKNAEREIYAVLQEEIQDDIRWTNFLTQAAVSEGQKRYEDSLFDGDKIEEMRNDFA